MNGDEEKARAAGCDHHVTKPYSPVQLLLAGSAEPEPPSSVNMPMLVLARACTTALLRRSQ